jgi:hypothetical protein
LVADFSFRLGVSGLNTEAGADVGRSAREYDDIAPGDIAAQDTHPMSALDELLNRVSQRHRAVVEFGRPSRGLTRCEFMQSAVGGLRFAELGQEQCQTHPRIRLRERPVEEQTKLGHGVGQDVVDERFSGAESPVEGADARLRPRRDLGNPRVQPLLRDDEPRSRSRFRRESARSRTTSSGGAVFTIHAPHHTYAERNAPIGP